MGLAETRALLVAQDWYQLWRDRHEIDWSYAAKHVPFEVQWFMVIASNIRAPELMDDDLIPMPSWVMNQVALDAMILAQDTEGNHGKSVDKRLQDAITYKMNWMNGYRGEAGILSGHLVGCSLAIEEIRETSEPYVALNPSRRATLNFALCVYYGLHSHDNSILTKSVRHLGLCMADNEIAENTPDAELPWDRISKESRIRFEGWVERNIAESIVFFTMRPNFQEFINDGDFAENLIF